MSASVRIKACNLQTCTIYIVKSAFAANDFVTLQPVGWIPFVHICWREQNMNYINCDRQLHVQRIKLSLRSYCIVQYTIAIVHNWIYVVVFVLFSNILRFLFHLALALFHGVFFFSCSFSLKPTFCINVDLVSFLSSWFTYANCKAFVRSFARLFARNTCSQLSLFVQHRQLAFPSHFFSFWFGLRRLCTLYMAVAFTLTLNVVSRLSIHIYFCTPPYIHPSIKYFMRKCKPKNFQLRNCRLVFAIFAALPVWLLYQIEAFNWTFSWLSFFRIDSRWHTISLPFSIFRWPIFTLNEWKGVLDYLFRVFVLWLRKFFDLKANPLCRCAKNDTNILVLHSEFGQKFSYLMLLVER